MRPEKTGLGEHRRIGMDSLGAAAVESERVRAHEVAGHDSREHRVILEGWVRGEQA